jgi:hypothetical protein
MACILLGGTNGAKPNLKTIIKNLKAFKNELANTKNSTKFNPLIFLQLHTQSSHYSCIFRRKGEQEKRFLEAILRPFSRFRGYVFSVSFFHLHKNHPSPLTREYGLFT